MQPETTEERILASLARIEARLESAVPGSRPGIQRAHSVPPEAPAAKRVASGGNDEEAWLELPEDQVTAIVAPFANEQRVKLLKALYLGIAESGHLKEFTGLTGGQLYHHLKELALAKFLSRQIRGEYRLSSLGYYAFSALMILMADLLAEELDEEVVTPEEIELD